MHLTSTNSNGRISVEAVVGLSVASLALVLFGLTFISRGERVDFKAQVRGQKSEDRSRTGGIDDRYRARPHEALAFGSDPAADSDRVEFDGQRLIRDPQDRSVAAATKVHPTASQHAVLPLQQSDGDKDTAMEGVTGENVTVLTPPLLVPVVNLAEHLDLSTSASSLQDKNGSSSARKPSVTRKHRRPTARTHYVRRHKQTRIVVGLAANRKFVVER